MRREREGVPGDVARGYRRFQPSALFGTGAGKARVYEPRTGGPYEPLGPAAPPEFGRRRNRPGDEARQVALGHRFGQIGEADIQMRFENDMYAFDSFRHAGHGMREIRILSNASVLRFRLLERRRGSILVAERAVDYGLIKASQRLSEIEIKLEMDGYAVDVYWFRIMFKEQDWYIRRHAHSTYEFHIIARGECEVETDEGSFRIGAGSFFLTAPGVYHTQRPTESPALVEYSLNCDLRRLSAPRTSVGAELARLRNVFLHAPCMPISDTTGLLKLFEHALREADQRQNGYELIVRGLVPMILVAAGRAMEKSERKSEDRETEAAPADYRMERIEAFVADNIRRDLTPADIASFMNLSEKQVSRIVMAHKGYSTKKFITRTKLRRAKEFLATTDQPIKEIAHELGFSSEYYFNSVFKKHEGFPPGVFRTSMRTQMDVDDE
jgi:AraC-like DNA-binding protein/mannose-6-phosphate isomerase-like protein (cupin superfamily)